MSTEPIHSGHFMTSNPHSEIQAEDEDEDVEVDVVDVDENTNAPAAEKRNTQDEKPMTFYKFGPHKAQSIAIDVSLNKLNKCIKIAYMKMTTPKWKDFKGLKLQWKHRIRLNNVIWRAYYMEFRKPDKRKKTPYCYFAVPDDDMTHTKSECNVLEGMYWKRRREGVCAQYKRWRTYNRHARRRPRTCCRKRENSCGCDPGIRGPGMGMPPQSRTPQHLVSDDFYMDDEFDNVFTDRLFESLDGPFLFPNPKESMQAGNADIMQPGLLSLQPSIEEIMNIDYSLSDGASGDGLAAFIDRVSRESNDNSPGVETPQQPSQYLSPQDASTASTSAVPPSRVGFSSQPMHQQQSKYLLAPSDTNNNARDRPARHFGGGKRLATASDSAYTAKEYDAANMLIDYSNQKNFLLSQQQQQQQQSFADDNSMGQLVVNGAGVPSKIPFAPPSSRYASAGGYVLKCESSPLEAETHLSLVQTHTPQPLYSQAFYSVNDALPGCANTTLSQQRHFSPLGQIGTATTTTTQRAAAPTTPAFQHLQQSSQQQQQLSAHLQQHQQQQQQQLHLSLHNNGVFFSSSAPSSAFSAALPQRTPVLPPSSSAVLTLDQYVLAAAVAASSAATSTAPPGTTIALNSLGGAQNANAPSLFNARTTHQLLQQQNWWLQSSTAASVSQSPSQTLTSSAAYESGGNQSSSALQSAQQQQQQQERAASALPQLFQPATPRPQPRDLLLIAQTPPLVQQQQQQRSLSTAPAAGSNAPTSLAGDLSRYLPTNIGISAPSSTVSTASVSLPGMFYATPATSAVLLQPTGSDILMSQSTSNPSSASRYDASGIVHYDGRGSSSAPGDADGSASTSQHNDAATILQFHQQCQQQQQQQQGSYVGSAKYEPLLLKVQSPGSAFGNPSKANNNGKLPSQPQQQIGQRQAFSKPYPTKKYSQPAADSRVIGGSITMQQRPSSSDIYGMDESSLPPNAKIQRRSNLSESVSLERMHHDPTQQYGPPPPQSASPSSTRGGWMSAGVYDATLSPRPLSSVSQTQQQLVSPHGVMVGEGPESAFATPSAPFTAPLAVPRQRHASSTAAPSSSSHMSTTKSLLLGTGNINNGDKVMGSTAAATVPNPPSGPHYHQLTQSGASGLQYGEARTPNGGRRGGGTKRTTSYTNTTASDISAGAQTTLSAAAATAAAAESKPIGQPADSNGSPLLPVAHHFGSCGGVDDKPLLGVTATCDMMAAATGYEMGTAVKEEQESRSPSQQSSQQEPIRHKGSASSGKRRGNSASANPASSNSAPADSTLHPEERKRILHLHAEKNRRSALKEGFDALVDAIPFVEQAGVKSTNAVVLNRAANHIRSLKTTSEERAAQVDALKQKIAHLNEKISLIQSNLPTTSRASSSNATSQGGVTAAGDTKGSAPSIRSQIEQFYERYSKERSKRDYRFWLMSEIFAPIVRSYAASVHPDANARDRVVESARQWLDREWNAAALRPLASETLVRVATASGIIGNDAPDALPKYIVGEITKMT